MNILSNYFKIAFRQVVRHKLFTAINVVGLAMSMTVGMLIIAMIFSLLKFDRFHEKKERIYRVISKVNEIERPEDEKAVAPFPLAERLQSLSSVEKTIRIRKRLNDFVIRGNNEILLDGYYTEPSFLQTFSFQLLDGDMETSLREPFSIVLTQRAARKLFNSEDVIGKSIVLKQLGTYKVTGLLAVSPLIRTCRLKHWLRSAPCQYWKTDWTKRVIPLFILYLNIGTDCMRAMYTCY